MFVLQVYYGLLRQPRGFRDSRSNRAIEIEGGVEDRLASCYNLDLLSQTTIDPKKASKTSRSPAKSKNPPKQQAQTRLRRRKLCHDCSWHFLAQVTLIPEETWRSTKTEAVPLVCLHFVCFLVFLGIMSFFTQLILYQHPQLQPVANMLGI